MSKTKIKLIIVGGIALLLVIAAGLFAWSQIGSRADALEGDEEGLSLGLNGEMEKAQRLSSKKVYPSKESVATIEESLARVHDWHEEALTFAARGDRPAGKLTAAQFKEKLGNEATRLRALPAGADVKTLSADFAFGPFKPYITEGKMPDQANLETLQRQWEDLATLVEVLSDAGVASITAVDVKNEVAKKEETPKNTKGKRRPPKKVEKRPSPEGAEAPVAFTYVVKYQARPAAFVRVLNALASLPRFMVVTDFSFGHEKDEILANLGGEKKDEAKPTRLSRRRGSQKAAAKEEKADEKPSLFTVVADPATEAPLQVSLTVKVYDFGSASRMREGEAK